jgi:predicted hydrocarbon binding protein
MKPDRDKNMHFEFDSETGVIRDKVTGERCLIITQARVVEICTRLSEIFQSGANLIIFEAGKATGKRFADEAVDIRTGDQQLFLKTISQRFTDAGLGKIEIVEFNPEKSEVTFRIWNNFFAELKSEKVMYRSCIEGFVFGMYEQIIGKTPKIQKTKCVADGDAYCEWQMTLK